MKNTLLTWILILILCSFFIACANPMSAEDEVIGRGGGLITITIGGNNARSAVSWANTLDSSQFTHKITFSGGEGGPHTKTIPAGGGTASFLVIPGKWTITIEAHYKGDLVAEGSETRQINEGNNGTVVIHMKEPPNFPSYSVSFDSKGGSAVINQSVKKYNKATRPTPPTLTGKGFVDWYKDQACTNEFDFDDAITEDMTLYAGWSTTFFTVTFYDTDNSTVLATQTIGEHGYASNPDITPNPGYTAKWFTDIGRSASWDFEINTVTAATSLYLTWTAGEYTVSLDSQGGSGGPSIETATYNQPMPAITSLPTRAGYTFSGYFDAATGGNQYYTANGTSAKNWDKTASATLYAQWTMSSSGTFTNIPDFRAWLDAQTGTGPYSVTLNVSSLGGGWSYIDNGSVACALYANLSKKVTIDLSGSSLSEIEADAFSDCSNLTSITLPSTITAIRGSAFIKTGIASVTIPNSVETIETNAFSQCSSLASVTLPNNPNFTSINCFSECSSLTSITIPSSVTDLEASAFKKSGLVSVTIPSSVNYIEAGAFDECDSLNTVIFAGTIPESGFLNNGGMVQAFPGDLRDKFYASDPINGTAGTYTRPANGTTWTKT